MENRKVYTAIGLMSGTSLDGIDAALIRTDGQEMVQPLGFVCLPYDPDLQIELRECLGKREPDEVTRRVERAMTLAHADAVRELLAETQNEAQQIDVIGFHGHTLTHDPAARFTWQIGDAALLACETGIPVVSDMRSADVKAGGQGAPLLPLYHCARATAERLPRPVSILNIGGVANVTWIGENSVLAFDTGPGGALLDDFVRKNANMPYDRDGALAAKGSVHTHLMQQWLNHPYFALKPPKSLDRNAFDLKSDLKMFSIADGAATLAAFTAHAVRLSLRHLPAPPAQWLVCGGGRRNPAIMRHLQKTLDQPVYLVEALGWNGDAIEAEGFGYLAVRSLLGLPLTLPETTGAPEPLTGGVLVKS